MQNGNAAVQYNTDVPAPVRDNPEQRMALEAKMQAIVADLDNLAEEQVKKKTDIENRWFEDLTQFHGKYDADTLKKLKEAEQSSLFVNLTRPKTNAWEARLSDMLFPTDDRNWGIAPTPVPELQEHAANKPDMSGFEDGQEVPPEVAKQAQTAQDATDRLDEARKRADAMQEEIDDQLTEARYNIKCRDAIHNGCKLGTGIIKAPVTAARNKRNWAKNGDDFELRSQPDPRPDAEHVDPWSFFPDMDARTVEESEFFFERHLPNAKTLRKWAKQDGFDKDAIRALLTEGPAKAQPDFIAKLRAITDGSQDSDDKRFVVWEYHGALTSEQIRDVCSCLGDDDTLEDIDDDPLIEQHVIIFFSQDKVLKFGLHSLDSGEPVYSVFNLEKDDTSIFGFGVPYLARDQQKALNGAWRMMMDNGGLSTGPQVVVDKGVLEPVDGVWTLSARKVWLKKDQNVPTNQAFGIFHIESRQQELVEIIKLCRQFIDEETNFPLVAQGEQATHVTDTAQGMAMLMNSANVVFRRAVKNWDDDMTTPNIRRFYDWNMQFSKKGAIKGDFEVDARGSSVLLVREVQAQNLMAMATQFTAHPVLGPLTKAPELYRSLVQAHMLPADKIVKTDEEIKQEQQAAAEQGQGQPDPETMKIDAQMADKEADRNLKRELATMAHETAMMKLAETQNIDLEKLRATLFDNQADRDHKERVFGAEVAVKERHGAGI